ncbi:DUF1223 domain-containing protein [Shimia marina]|nr:DUF1223 domain-containing protein [Shimia marina]
MDQSMMRVSGILAAIWMSVASAVVAEDMPVVVELYTSQGCSSCPPADDYFHRQLAGRQDVIALALHVDYWDYIGWKDEFASPAYTQRQHTYARAAGHRSVYTPQMIVNGKDHVVGAHPDQVEKLISAHKAVKRNVDLDVKRDGDLIEVKAKSDIEAPMVVHVMRYRAEEKISIKRGENAGRVLTYANIVDGWEKVQSWNGAADLSLNLRVKGDQPVVVIIQRESGGPIEAAARVF